jgi:Tfp pilus assembly protein PilO
VFAEFYRKYSMWIIAGVVVLLANAGVFFLLTLPRLDAEAANRKRLARMLEQKTELSRILDERRDLLTLIEDNRENLQRFYNDVLGTRSQRLIEILAEREEIGGEFGVAPTQVRYETARVQNLPLEKFTMSFPLTGTYESLRFFVDTLEHSDNFFIIQDIELESGRETESELGMRISISTYFHGGLPVGPEEELTESDVIPEEEAE